MNDDGKPLPDQPHLQNWRELAEKASKEPDQDKVLDLVRQLDERLEEAGETEAPADRPDSAVSENPVSQPAKALLTRDLGYPACVRPLVGFCWS